MSNVRRSPRLAARANAYATLRSIQEVLQERLEQIEQAPALKDGWITKMMNDFLSSQSTIEDLMYKLRCIMYYVSFKHSDIHCVMSLSHISWHCTGYIRTIRGGDHRPLDELESTTRDMLHTVETLLSRVS